MIQEYYAHGKLLLTAEYVVLDGAWAIALPTQKGQRMEVELQASSSHTLQWKSFDFQGQIWLEGVWDIQSQSWSAINHPEKAKYISILLKYAQNEIGIDLSGYMVSTFLEFQNEWGLGSSSTLIALIAQWWKVDPYYLLQLTFGGSGYDIACAQASQAIFYQRTPQEAIVREIDFSPEFRNHLAFVYLGKKQNSREGIQYYKNLAKSKEAYISAIDTISAQVSKCQDLEEFERLMIQHEKLISEMLQMESVKNKRFSDYSGIVKSLGAWGGDFVLITHDGNTASAQKYFLSKGLDTFIPYDEMIL